jgi:hypothetical protein
MYRSKIFDQLILLLSWSRSLRLNLKVRQKRNPRESSVFLKVRTLGRRATVNGFRIEFAKLLCFIPVRRVALISSIPGTVSYLPELAGPTRFFRGTGGSPP